MPERPLFLSFLLWAGLLANVFAMMLVSASFFMHQGGAPDMTTTDAERLPVYLQWLVDYWFTGHRFFYPVQLVRVLLLILTLYGFKLMFGFHRRGFYIFTVAQVLLVVLPFTFIWENPIARILTSLQFFVVGLYVFLLATQIKFMD